MRKVLFVTRVFSPYAPGKFEKLSKRCRYFEKHGWQCHVISPSDNGLDSDRIDKFLEGCAKTQIHIVPDILSPIRQFYNSNIRRAQQDNSRFLSLDDKVKQEIVALRRNFLFPDPWVGMLPYALGEGFKLCKREKIDLLYTASYPNTAHFVGYFLKNLTGLPWIAEFRDPWLNNPMIRKTKIWKLITPILEGIVVKNADRLVIYKGWFPDGVDYFKTQYPKISQEKIELLPYVGYDPDAFANIIPAFHDDTFTIIYAGNFYGGDYSPKTFLSALRKAVDEISNSRDGIRVIFIGGFSKEYQRMVTDLQLDDTVEYLGFLSHPDALSYILSSDVGLWVIGQSIGSPENIPSKVFDYLGAHKPILALLPEGPASEFIRKKRFGVVVSIGDVDGIKNAIIELYKQYHRDELVLLDGVDMFSRNNMLNEFIKIMEELVAG